MVIDMMVNGRMDKEMEWVYSSLIRIGVMTYIDGSKYNGDWLNDKEANRGTLQVLFE